MKYFKLNIGTKLFILYFLVSSTLVWAFAHRTSIESAKEVMVEVATMFSKIASQNIIDGEINLTTFGGIIFDYFQSPHGDERLQNLAIYITDKDGFLILDSRGLSLGTDMKSHSVVGSALSGQQGISRISTEPVRGPRKARGINIIEYFFKPEFLYVSSIIYDNRQEVQGVLVLVAPMLDLMDRTRLWRFIFYIFLLSLFFGALGSYRISRNIRRVEKYTRELFKGEDVSIPYVNVQFNKLAVAIEQARSEVELKDDVEEYIDTLAHELRTPITGIRLTAENLLTPMGIESYLLEEKDDKKSKVLTKEIKKRREFIRSILDSNKQMDSLVSRLLALSRIERRDKLTNTEKLKILPIIENVLKVPTHNRLIVSKNITINLDGVDKKSTVFAEKILLEQALSNILKNALEFSPKASTINIKSSESNTFVTIVVLDEGPGIPPHVSSKLFTRFFSVARPDTGRRGTGLGLRFVRKIMQLHGGEFTLKNRLLQVGTEAKLRFPLS